MVMLIEIHVIQNHSPANLNRDDLGAPKTCYFGGVLRSRISSQCIKRSIRKSREFHALLGGVRTRQLARVIAMSDEEFEKLLGGVSTPNSARVNAARGEGTGAKRRAERILDLCGFKPKKVKNEQAEGDEAEDQDRSKMLVYTTREAIKEMRELLQDHSGKTDAELADVFAELINEDVVAPDMALCGRMLEPDRSAKKVWKGLDTTVEAALQVAHAISTHAARPEVDYYVAADDIPGDDAGAGYVDEAMFASACFYKYFSIDWETLAGNLKGNKQLAAHTVGAFLRGAALVNPTGKQNSYAAHNPPDGILVEIKDTPISYANAFAKPVQNGKRDIISQSIAQLAQYIHDTDVGYGKPHERFWFSPNLRYHLSVVEDKQEIPLAENNMDSLPELVAAVVAAIGFDWEAVQKVKVNPEVAP
jgi:CRISPR system Cascade subunit CasC